MKVILDTNVYVSYLLSRQVTGTIQRVVRACLLAEEVRLIAPQEVLDELRDISSPPKLWDLISTSVLDRLSAQLLLVAQIVPVVAKPTTYTRDQKDDHLVVQGILHHADYLVTGDLDLLVLSNVEALRIVSPAAFVDILADAGLLES